MSDLGTVDVPDLFSPEDVAVLREHAAVGLRLVDHYVGLKRPLTAAERADLDRLIASMRELKVVMEFLRADSPGDAIRAALGDLTPPTRSS